MEAALFLLHTQMICEDILELDSIACCSCELASSRLDQRKQLTVLQNCFYLPGCLVGGFLMDKIGRKQTMTLGFFCWSVLGFIIGGALGPIQSIFPLFVVLYGIFNSFGEMGPGVATL